MACDLRTWGIIWTEFVWDAPGLYGEYVALYVFKPYIKIAALSGAYKCRDARSPLCILVCVIYVSVALAMKIALRPTTPHLLIHTN